MKQTLWALLALLAAVNVSALEVNEGKWRITLDDQTRRLTIANGGNILMSGAYAQAVLEGTAVNSYDAVEMTTAESEVSDCFGQGKKYAVTYLMGDGTRLLQSLSFYPALPYFIVQLEATRDGGEVRSNRLSPLLSTATAAFLPDSKQNRMLFVPWDNDGFISYASNYLRKEMYSYTVTAIFNSDSRYGLITGAVDHDFWKSAVHVNASDYYKVNELALISGYTDEHTHDSIRSENRIMPHGAMAGDTVRSSRFMFGCFDDWRVGLETFGQACTRVVPRREWSGGVPYGWSSWGVQSTDISYQGVIDCGSFIRDNLMPHGFHDAQGKVVLSLDAWWNDNLSVEQVKKFVAYCKDNDMIPGLYYGSFCRFGGLDDGVPGTNGKYTFRDIALKVNGRYKVVDGAYCLDPTHPGTKIFIMTEMQKFRQWGVEYLKCDFMSNGAIEADSWYNKNCRSGIQAYNEGMKFLVGKAGDDIYIDLSISPAFPYQYAHGRRISCDAWGSIDQTKYVMNNTSYGWWLNQVYFACDPDHMVMKGRPEGIGIQSDGANRARLTSGAVTGAYLTGDNFSDNVNAGYPEKSREAALKFLTNQDVNEIPRTCHAFRPLYGDAKPDDGAEKLVTYENDSYVYLAVFSYQILSVTSGEVKYADLGIAPGNVGEIKELWTGSTVTTTADGFKYNVPYCDARIYRITKKSAAGIKDVTGEREANPAAGGVRVYDLQGRRVDARFGDGRLPKGIYIQGGRKVAVQ